jgi:hypothetical protein
MNTIDLIANDVIGRGELNIYFGSRASVAPFGFDFERKSDDNTVTKSSFNLSICEAKRLAAFIVENL